jgi:hypothetical protein
MAMPVSQSIATAFTLLAPRKTARFVTVRVPTRIVGGPVD